MTEKTSPWWRPTDFFVFYFIFIFSLLFFQRLTFQSTTRDVGVGFWIPACPTISVTMNSWTTVTLTPDRDIWTFLHNLNFYNHMCKKTCVWIWLPKFSLNFKSSMYNEGEGMKVHFHLVKIKENLRFTVHSRKKKVAWTERKITKWLTFNKTLLSFEMIVQS